MQTYTYEIKFTVNIEAMDEDEADEKASNVEIVPSSGVFEDEEGFEFNQIID